MSKQPLHIQLRQYRVMPIGITLFFMVLAWDMWGWFQGNHKELSDWANSSFIAMAGLALGALKWSLEHMTRKQEKDDHDHDS